MLAARPAALCNEMKAEDLMRVVERMVDELGGTTFWSKYRRRCQR